MSIGKAVAALHETFHSMSVEIETLRAKLAAAEARRDNGTISLAMAEDNARNESRTEIEQLREEKYAALARAEKAEAERDAAMAEVERLRAEAKGSQDDAGEWAQQAHDAISAKEKAEAEAVSLADSYASMRRERDSAQAEVERLKNELASASKFYQCCGCGSIEARDKRIAQLTVDLEAAIARAERAERETVGVAEMYGNMTRLRDQWRGVAQEEQRRAFDLAAICKKYEDTSR